MNEEEVNKYAEQLEQQDTPVTELGYLYQDLRGDAQAGLNPKWSNHVTWIAKIQRHLKKQETTGGERE